MATNILKEVEYNDGNFPREILLQAIEQKDETIPELLEILERTCEDAENLAEEGDYFAHIYALYLLAQFREHRAFPLICSLLTKPYEILDKLLGDMITEGLPSILASVFDGDLKPLQNIIENEEIDEFIRSSVLYPLIILVGQGIVRRDEIATYFQHLFHGGLKREYSFVWDALAGCCYHLYPEELINDIELAYDEGLIDPTSTSYKEIKDQLDKGKETVLRELSDNQFYQLINDTISELKDWACFNENKNEVDQLFREDANFYESIIKKQEPYRVEHKIGRNDPCPCGSGKKYKKCCGKNV